ncbi:unnamed protein product [Leptidea sinapis]|uniref:Uncharacterized protein n=1 Tax=Leptidea sinapis TaxID=189913 RepID=A0A5E4Q6P1_9NEOP|nr:unnamed protein product [Leptidea sinapis]
MDSSRLALEIAKLQSTEKNRCRDVAYELRNCITSQERMKLPDNHVGCHSRRVTHVAFDNFDRFVDTATGKDTLHDTVGIIYQFHSENDDPNNTDSSDTSDSESLGAYVHEGPTEPLARVRKRRRFEAPSKEIRPFPTITEIYDACHSEKLIAIDKDLIWSMSLSRIDSVPMWLVMNSSCGINESIVLPDSLLKKSDYLKQMILLIHYRRIESRRTLKTLNNIIGTIKKTMNPFSENIDKNSLFNLSTGKAASLNVANFLLNVKSLGEEQKLKFFSECFEDSSRFVRPITRSKINNFASDCIKRSVKSTTGDKKTLLKMERDIFGRLLAIAINQKVDIEYCLSFPLAPVPPALFHCSGDMMKTDKSTLGKQLIAKIAPANPGQVDIEIIDGFYYLYQIGSTLPQTFGKIAESILMKLCSKNAPEVQIIFDRYLTPSIKDCERQNREGIDIPYTINGPLQKRPNDFLKSLKNFRFKEVFVKFLASHWVDDSFAPILGNKKIYQCFSYCSVGNFVVKPEETELACKHEEADTRIVFHISKVPENSKILVKASDTDVLIILLGNMHKFPNLHIWLANNSSSKSKNKVEVYINCTELSKKLGATLCLALPAFHAYTGCDYTAAFLNKEKLRPLNLLIKNPEIQQVFASLTNPTDIFNENKIDAVQEFTCLIDESDSSDDSTTESSDDSDF